MRPWRRPRRRGQGESLLGVTSHFLHHDMFFPDLPRFWRV